MHPHTEKFSEKSQRGCGAGKSYWLRSSERGTIGLDVASDSVRNARALRAVLGIFFLAPRMPQISVWCVAGVSVI